jgi:hypothetical protein
MNRKLSRKLRLVFLSFILAYSLNAFRLNYIHRKKSVRIPEKRIKNAKSSQNDDAENFVKTLDPVYQIHYPTWIEKNNSALIGYPKSLSEPIRLISQSVFGVYNDSSKTNAIRLVSRAVVVYVGDGNHVEI